MNDSFSIEINDLYTRMSDSSIVTNKIEITHLAQKETVPYFYSSLNDAIIEKQAALISQLQNESKITKKNVNVVIPDAYTYSQIIEMPSLKEKELLAAIHYQADEFIPMPIEDTSLDLEVLKEDPKTKKSLILIVASPKAIVNQVDKAIQRANLTAYSLENELSAIGRLFSDILKPKGGATLILNIGLNNSSVYVIDGESSLIILNRSFNLGLNLFIKGVSVNLNWDDKKAADALRTIGLASNASIDLSDIVNPLTKELYNELEKIQILIRDRYNKKIETIYTMNFSSGIASINEKVQEHLSITTKPLQLETFLGPNLTNKTTVKDIKPFISAIAGNLR